MWIIFSTLSAIFFSVEYLCQKRLSSERGIYSAGYIVLLFSLPFLLALVFFQGEFLHLAAMPWRFWWPLLVIWFVLYPGQTYFYMRALREGEFSLVMPVMSILPVFNIFVSWVFLGEIPNLFGILGIALISVSVFILLKPKEGKVLSLKSYSRAGFFMILFCVGVAFGSTFDKVAVQVSEPAFYTFLNVVGGTLVMATLALIFGRKRDDISYMRKNFGFVSFAGLAHAASFAFYILSLGGGFVSYSLAIRSSSFIIAALFGFFMYKEPMTKGKIASLVLIVFGLFALSFA